MNYLEAYLNPFRRYGDFRGRSARHSYWVFAVVNGVLGLIDQIFLNAVRDNITSNATPQPGLLVPVSVITFYFIAALIPSLSSQVRRLHDTGRSGWYALLNLLPLIGPVLLLIFSAQDSQPGENRWGPSPKPGNVTFH